MCYQCSGCGRCLGKDVAASEKRTCPCCRAEVPDDVKACPQCGAYIRPVPGSLGKRKPASPSVLPALRLPSVGEAGIMDASTARRSRKLIYAASLVLLIMVCASFQAAYADGGAGEPAPSDEQRYQMGSTVNAGMDIGFVGAEEIKSGDPHSGWEIGEFFLSGYGSVSHHGEVVEFRVPKGGSVGLWFQLWQNIDMLNADPGFSISDDVNGEDIEMGVSEQDFGRGALIVARKGWDSSEEEIEVTPDYLSEHASLGQVCEVGCFSAGHHRVSLDYELREDVLVFLEFSVLPEFCNYKIAFEFDVVESPDAIDAASVASVDGAMQEGDARHAIDSTRGGDAQFEQIAGQGAGMLWWQAAVACAALVAGCLIVVRLVQGRKR